MTVTGFTVAGSTIYSQDELQSLVRPFIGREIRLSDIYALAAEITTKYGKDGYVLSRAIVPPQSLSLKGSVVRLEVVEGYIDGVTWPEGLKEKYRDFFSDYERKILASRPSNIAVVERYLLLASDLPGLKFSSTFKPSERNSKASHLVITATEKRIGATAGFDNWGAKGRGPWQAQASGTINNALGLHEALSARFATAVPSTDELLFAEGSYQQVLTSEGLTLNATGSYNKGLPGLAALQALKYDSEGIFFTVGLSYPVIRSRDQNLTVSGLGFSEDVTTTTLDKLFTNDRLRGVRIRIDYDRADAWGGINLLQGIVSQGIDGLGNTSSSNPLASRLGGKVDFTKVEVTATHTQPLPFISPEFSLYGAVYGQYSPDPLLLPEECTYGGRLFGRAFDPSALTGDNCGTGLTELRYDPIISGNMFSKTELYGFVDIGVVTRNENKTAVPDTQWASSAGGGLRLGWRDNMSFGAEAEKSIAGDLKDSWRGHLEMTVKY